MGDAIELTQRGVPAVALVTQRFLALAQAVARGKGVPNLPIVVLPPNVDYMSEAELGPVADTAFDEAVSKLVRPGKPQPAT
ncbi:MAG: hypothetical protein Q7T26_05115 [Dehalococcoidia bacterium]|nr:hypothetical protein [Dehalococcoidia bacterium]